MSDQAPCTFRVGYGQKSRRNYPVGVYLCRVNLLYSTKIRELIAHRVGGPIGGALGGQTI